MARSRSGIASRARIRGRNLRGKERCLPDTRPDGPLLQRRRRPRRCQQQRPWNRRLRDLLFRRERRIRDGDRHQRSGRAHHRRRHAPRLRSLRLLRAGHQQPGPAGFPGTPARLHHRRRLRGPDPKKDAIITSRDKLDGARILSVSFSVCSEALNDSGEVVFIADLLDPTVLEGFRSAIYLASPKKPVAP